MRLPRIRIRRPGPLSAFSRMILRSIRGSLGRFFAIFGIVSLGCGFYAGLQMVGTDMRKDADEYYSGTNLYDIRVVSTRGFTKSDVDRLSSIEGVSEAMGAIGIDAMAELGLGGAAVRVSTLDIDDAKRGKQEGANTILSANGAYLNRVFLRRGRWPSAPDECVVTDDKKIEGVDIGSEVKVLYGTEDLDDILDVRTFSVVGTVSSASYPYTGNFGYTTLGSGQIVSYLYVQPEAFKDSAPFTDIYLTVEGADELESGSDAYQAKIDSVKDKIYEQEDELVQARYDDMVAKGRKDIDEAKQKVEDAKAESDKKIEDGQKELDDAQAQIDEGQRQYDSGLAEWEAGRDAAYLQLDAAQRQIDEGQQKADTLKAEIDQLKATSDANEAYVMRRAVELGLTSSPNISSCRLKLRQEDSRLSQQIERYDSRQEVIDTVMNLEQEVARMQAYSDSVGASAQIRVQRNTKAAELASERATLEVMYENADTLLGRAIDDAARTTQEAKVATLDAEVASLDALLVETERNERELAVKKLELDTAQRRLKTINDRLAKMDDEAGLRARQAEVAQLISTADEVVKNRTTVSAKQFELALVEAQVKSGTSQLETQRASAEAELLQGKAKLDDAKAQLDESKRKLEEGKLELEDGRKEADEKIGEAEEEIEEGEQKIEDVERPELYVLDRTNNQGIESHSMDAGRIDAIANVFPLMFFLVAALVALTTMTRMVEEERTEIGTFKALGYSVGRIASKYLIYAGAASGAGALVGIGLFSQILPLIIISSYHIIYAVPIAGLPMPIDLVTALQAILLGVGITLLTTYVAVVKTLQESPATLMLPKTPPAGKRILLERIKPLWNSLSFSWKVTLRNMFREKGRMFMTIIGIAGCTSLLLVAFALHDAIWDIFDRQYGPIQDFDVIVALDDDATETDMGRVEDYFEGLPETEKLVRMQQESMLAGESGDDALNVTVRIARTPEEIKQCVTFRDRALGTEIEFDENSVLVSEKLARLLNVGTGDAITCFERDMVGGASGKGMRFTVTGVNENYAGYYLYCGLKAWRDAGGDEPRFTTVVAKCGDMDEERERVIGEDLLAMDKVSTVGFTTEAIQSYRNMLSVVDFVVWVLVLAAALLCLIVIYNLTNINIGERIREIASLKVLGFTKREVYTYIFREVRLLGVIGALLGLFLGTALAQFVVITAEADYVMFGRTIYPRSYIISFIVTIIFTQLVLLLMRKKLDRVDMVESMKSVD